MVAVQVNDIRPAPQTTGKNLHDCTKSKLNNYVPPVHTQSLVTFVAVSDQSGTDCQQPCHPPAQMLLCPAPAPQISGDDWEQHMCCKVKNLLVFCGPIPCRIRQPRDQLEEELSAFVVHVVSSIHFHHTYPPAHPLFVRWAALSSFAFFRLSCTAILQS